MNSGGANNWLLYTLGLFFLTTGASLWETAIFTPAWSKSPPVSMQILDTMDPKIFWGIVHSLFEMCFIITLVVNWKIKERKFRLLGIFMGYAVLRIWTLSYFAPTYMHFEAVAHHPVTDDHLSAHAILWKHLNYIRTCLLIIVNILLLLFVQKIMSKETEISA